ncbi:SnoaL-like domain-containing protein [Flavobacterium sp.]|uniref:SnoaL-like domain-containing protein n=1 Tax=Flavobacterium sp. TaxID=239 RepID=UPI00261D7753|nr:SnoaL-like domain-containing protein [Flavobacterium sp.]
MSEQHISVWIDELVSLAVGGQWEVAFEKFYHQDIEKTDLDGVPVTGMSQNIENGRSFSSKISNVRDFSCAGKIVKGNRSFIVWSFDFDVECKPFKVTEVAIQDWEDGKIIKERFFA